MVLEEGVAFMVAESIMIKDFVRDVSSYQAQTKPSDRPCEFTLSLLLFLFENKVNVNDSLFHEAEMVMFMKSQRHNCRLILMLHEPHTRSDVIFAFNVGVVTPVADGGLCFARLCCGRFAHNLIVELRIDRVVLLGLLSYRLLNHMILLIILVYILGARVIQLLSLAMLLRGLR